MKTQSKNRLMFVYLFQLSTPSILHLFQPEFTLVPRIRKNTRPLCQVAARYEIFHAPNPTLDGRGYHHYVSTFAGRAHGFCLDKPVFQGQ